MTNQDKLAEAIADREHWERIGSALELGRLWGWSNRSSASFMHPSGRTISVDGVLSEILPRLASAASRAVATDALILRLTSIIPGLLKTPYFMEDGEESTYCQHNDKARVHGCPICTLAAALRPAAEGKVDERGELEADVARLRTIIHDSYGYLPAVGSMAFVDFDLTPHVVDVADEFAVLQAQNAALETEVSRLKTQAALDRVGGAEAVRRAGQVEWISVEADLPEFSHHVLVYSEDNKCIAVASRDWTLADRGPDAEWFWRLIYGGDVLRYHNVTHWSDIPAPPLPVPPEGGTTK